MAISPNEVLKLHSEQRLAVLTKIRELLEDHDFVKASTTQIKTSKLIRTEIDVWVGRLQIVISRTYSAGYLVGFEVFTPVSASPEIGPVLEAFQTFIEQLFRETENGNESEQGTGRRSGREGTSGAGAEGTGAA